jgi:hypothetical protein
VYDYDVNDIRHDDGNFITDVTMMDELKGMVKDGGSCTLVFHF